MEDDARRRAPRPSHRRAALSDVGAFVALVAHSLGVSERARGFEVDLRATLNRTCDGASRPNSRTTSRSSSGNPHAASSDSHLIPWSSHLASGAAPVRREALILALAGGFRRSPMEVASDRHASAARSVIVSARTKRRVAARHGHAPARSRPGRLPRRAWWPPADLGAPWLPRSARR